MMCSTLIGCSSKTDEVKEVTQEYVTENMKKPSNNENVVLTVWGGEEDQDLLAEMVEAFKSNYAGQASFDITVAVESEATCRDTLLEDVQNGADVFAFADDQLMTMVAAGALVPVINADEVNNANLVDSVSAATVHDKMFAYPMTADNGYFMYYNKEYFSETDVESLDAMLAVAAAAEKKVTMDWTSGWYLYSFFGSTGMSLGLNDDGVTNFCDWNRTEGDIKGVDVAQAMLDIALNPGFASAVNDKFIAGVQDGSAIAGISGVWDANTIKEAWGSNYGAVKLPTYTCAGQQIQMASFSGYKMVGVNAYSDHTEWGLKLADWITNQENQELRFVRREQGPSNTKAADSEEVKKAPAIQAVISQSQFGSLQRVGTSYWSPLQTFGETLASGNPEGIALQELVDKMVDSVTASAVQ